jgi:hypothetical protein
LSQGRLRLDLLVLLDQTKRTTKIPIKNKSQQWWIVRTMCLKVSGLPLRSTQSFSPPTLPTPSLVQYPFLRIQISLSRVQIAACFKAPHIRLLLHSEKMQQARSL